MPETISASVHPIRLTIGIPTFNRHECLASTIKRLVPQLTSECKLLIVDNASQPPVIDTVGPLLAELGISTARVVRNKTNIGGGANILRCMELCETEWLWILGDDDRIWDDAVEKILEGIDTHPTCTCVNFAQNAYPRNEASTTRGRTEFLSVLGCDFYNVFFISTSIYRVKAILPSMRYGYMQISSYAPHVAVLLMGVDTSGEVYFSANTIVEWVPARKGSGWSPFWIERGLPLLLDLPIEARDRSLLKKILRSRLHLKGLLAAYLDVLCYGLRTQDLAVCAQLYRMIALRRATVSRSPIEWLLIRGLLATLLAPRLALTVTQSVYRGVTGRTLQVRTAAAGLSHEERI